MLRSVYIALVLACLAAYARADEEEKYPDKYDHLDVNELLMNVRLRNQYYNCFIDAGPCVTPDAIFFKERFPEAIVTKCRRCTDRQRDAFEKIAVWYNENDPAGWEKVMRKGVEDFTKRAALKKMAEKSN